MDSKLIRVDKNQQILKYHNIIVFCMFLALKHSAQFYPILPELLSYC